MDNPCSNESRTMVPVSYTHLIGAKNPDRVQMIQFHQSYSYEDFIEGYRPTENGFTIKKGSFYKFCKLAEEDDENDYFFIIDEINRGNLSKIFGELFMLIEKDKRGIELQLLYSDENFSVPANVYIIGMMNTCLLYTSDANTFLLLPYLP